MKSSASQHCPEWRFRFNGNIVRAAGSIQPVALHHHDRASLIHHAVLLPPGVTAHPPLVSSAKPDAFKPQHANIFVAFKTMPDPSSPPLATPQSQPTSCPSSHVPHERVRHHLVTRACSSISCYTRSWEASGSLSWLPRLDLALLLLGWGSLVLLSSESSILYLLLAVRKSSVLNFTEKTALKRAEESNRFLPFSNGFQDKSTRPTYEWCLFVRPSSPLRLGGEC